MIHKDVGVSGLIRERFGPVEVKLPHPCGVSTVTCRAATGKKAFTPGIETALIS